MHNDNSLSPPPPMQAIHAPPVPPKHPTLPTLPVAPSSVGSKKRHRSNDSEDVEEVVSSPKKHNSHRPLGLPGANIKIENRGNFQKDHLKVEQIQRFYEIRCHSDS